MTSAIANPIPILRGSQETCLNWISDYSLRNTATCIVIIFCGCGLYGASMGCWRSPELALYVAIKFPILVLLTLLINGLINGMLALVLGSGLSIRQTLQSQLMAYMIMALILGSLSPVVFGVASTSPPHGSDSENTAHRAQLLIHVCLVAYAGVVSNYKLFQMLHHKIGHRRLALQTLFVWWAVNLFVGAQLSWNLRPFFGTPGLEVDFLRPDALQGTFYESVFKTLRNLIQSS